MSYLLYDVRDIKIRPFSKSEIEEFFMQLCIAEKLILSDQARVFLLSKLTDGCPNYTQLLIDKICKINKGNTGELDIDAIKKQYNQLTSESNISFKDFHDRLKRYLPDPEYLAARKILYHLARKELSFNDMYPQVKELMESKKELDKLLQRLIDENYILLKDSLYSFVSPVLKDWWTHYIKWED